MTKNFAYNTPAMRMRTLALGAITLICVFPFRASSDQTRLQRYEPTARKIFWAQLYANGSSTLYCGVRFKETSKRFQVEHIYAASWMGDHLKCSNRDQCRKKSKRFNSMEADLHNLYPELAEVNRARSNYLYGIIEGESQSPRATCDFKYSKEKKLAEPRKIARGNVARAIFYMHTEYGLPIAVGMLPLLKNWNREDRVSFDELRRNREIDVIQGTRNPFIDKPSRADQIQ